MSKGNAKDYDYLIKIVILGETGVGKTSLMYRYINDEFDPMLSNTNPLDFLSKLILLEEKQVKLQICDPLKQERFRNIPRSSRIGAMGYIVCYDITDVESFRSVNEWLEKIKIAASKHAQVVLVGTKKDLEDERQVATEDGENLASDNGIPFFEISAKDGYNLNEVFETLCRNVIEVYKKREEINKTSEKIDKKKRRKGIRGCFLY